MSSMPISRERRKVFVRGFILLFWCAVIFSFSHLPGSGLDVQPSLWYILERKSAHIFEFAILTGLAFWFFLALYPEETRRRVVFLSAAFALCYGIFDELHQFFIFGRGARFSDVMVDGLGIFFALAFVYAKRSVLSWNQQRGTIRSMEKV